MKPFGFGVLTSSAGVPSKGSTSCGKSVNDGCVRKGEKGKKGIGGGIVPSRRSLSVSEVPEKKRL